MELAAPAAAAAPARPRGRFSFTLKCVLALSLIALGDLLFYRQSLGSTLGFYALALLVSAALAVPSIRRNRAAVAAAAAALVYAVALADDPSLLAWALFWTAATMAVLLPRVRRFDDGWRWAMRLVLHALMSAAGPLMDLARLRRARHRAGPARLAPALRLLLLPALGSALFLALFSAANPLIGEAFARIDLSRALGGLSVVRLVLWALLAVLVWGLLRAPRESLPPQGIGEAEIELPAVNPLSLLLSLAAFNAVFAVQNGLDIAFLWSGAPLPGDMTLAEYAHRGAYPLIATALLAALFVLVTLDPGSAVAQNPLARRLVYLWIGQNVLLVASTMMRTFDYVEAYSLTRLRIAALVWMALVAVGLVLICWRIARGRSGAWLINANLAAAAAALTACAFVDLGAVAAQWNVRHAREVGGRGTRLDLCYLYRIGPSSLLPLVELEGRRLPPDLAERATWVRNVLTDRLEHAQRDWHGWTFRNHRRLVDARRLVTERRLPRYSAGRRNCDGSRIPPGALDSSSPEM